MDFSQDTINKYPLCKQFASTELQPAKLKKQKPKVWNAFVKACESEKWARIALDWDSSAGPTITPMDGLLTPNAAHNNILGCGFTRAPRFNAPIEITSLLFNAVEHSVWEGDRDFAKLHFEVTVLHELVHWSRFNSGATNLLWTDPPIAMAEAGSVFEMWAYGQLFCGESDVERLMLSTRF
jgi:Metallopeptidase toxin 3